MDLEVRAEAPGDQDAVHAVVRAAFDGGQRPGHAAGDRVVALLAALRRDHCWRDLSLVAVRDGREVLGHVAMTAAWVDAPSRLVDVLVLSPLSVRPDVQRRGVGRALIEGAVAAAGEAGHPLVFLEGDPAYYSRRGFVAGAGLGFTPPSIRIPAAGFQVRVSGPYDAAGVRGALVYPDVFWRLDCVGLRPAD